MRTSLYIQLRYFGLAKLYHGLSWFIMVYHGLSWFMIMKTQLKLPWNRIYPTFLGHAHYQFAYTSPQGWKNECGCDSLDWQLGNICHMPCLFRFLCHRPKKKYSHRSWGCRRASSSCHTVHCGLLQKKGLLQTAKQVCNAPSVDGLNMFQGYSFKHVLRHLIKKTQSTTRLVAWKTSNCGRRVSDFEKVSSGQMLESYGCNTSKNEVKHQNEVGNQHK